MARYNIIDPRPIALSAPYTYFLPDDDLLKAIKEGDYVKAVVAAIPPSEMYEAERMWIQVNSVDADWLEGTLYSEPEDMPHLPMGSAIRLLRSHVTDVILDDPARAAQLPTKQPRREYWDRCLVDQAVLDGDLIVEYIYREPPDMTKDDDRFPDSGWRIRGDTRGKLIDQIGNREVAYVALGAVLNQDDSWLHLVDEPVGTRFERDYATNKFVREK